MPTDTERSELERLKQQVEEEHQMYLRALADFDNFRRRVERERANSAQSGKRDLLLAMLELLDSLDRALPHFAEAPPAASNGVEALHRQFLSTLQAQGVKPYDAIGEAFDPARHEAVGGSPHEDAAPGTVTHEVRRGYLWGDELLRPARVLVAQ
jgi:molecular chaperone GrpE